MAVASCTISARVLVELQKQGFDAQIGSALNTRVQ